MPERRKDGWTRVAFGDVVELVNERSYDPEGRRVRAVRGWRAHRYRTTFGSAGGADVGDGYRRSQACSEPGRSCSVMRRAYQRKVAVADFDGVCSARHLSSSSRRTDVLLPELLPFICRPSHSSSTSSSTSAGSLSPYDQLDEPVAVRVRPAAARGAAADRSALVTLRDRRPLRRSCSDCGDRIGRLYQRAAREHSGAHATELGTICWRDSRCGCATGPRSMASTALSAGVPTESSQCRSVELMMGRRRGRWISARSSIEFRLRAGDVLLT